MINSKRIIFGVLVLVIILVGMVVYNKHHKSTTTPVTTTGANQPTQTPATPVVKQIVDPIADAEARVTKKPFGIYVTPQNSPVSPERFTGWHTGTDFETYPSEANIAVPFYAICAGKILVKQFGSGYGGMFVQSCTINNQAVTVVYGHVSLTSITKNVGDTLAQGEKIGNLGHSPDETDGERKHLHLGIHIGAAVNTSGYVATKAQLAGWMDFQKITP